MVHIIGDKLQNKDSGVDIRPFNIIFQCVVCQSWKFIQEEKPIVVSQFVKMMPLPPNKENRVEFNPVISPVCICQKCNKNLALPDQESKIAVPTFVPPNNIKH